MFKIYNPINWGEPAYVVVNGTVTQAFNASYENPFEELVEHFNSSEFNPDEYRIIDVPSEFTTIREQSEDAYPVDDPGYCFYSWYEVC